MCKFVYFILLNYYCLCIDDNNVYIEITDNAFELDRLFYGDLTNVKEMFLPPLGDQTVSVSEEDKINETKKQIDLNFEYLKSVSGPDITEYNEITKLINNETRRWRGWYQGWNDPQDPYDWYSTALETSKKQKMININIQYLIHARYQVRKALLKKYVIRTDKRYKIGYLFNRLKRIKYEQQKIVGYAHEQMKLPEFRDFTSLIRLYEKVVRYDVDITDTIKYIKEIDEDNSKLIQIPEMNING
ncbi:unnamed protein product [Euphydryas editha]|uniref:Uncharacterized protein n=1 Tax=Euphydryas editha TaxID=104508 RepID=A0AAU9TVA1_EUPED|nr:unnamed protein product [Euphydryas editha]